MNPQIPWDKEILSTPPTHTHTHLHHLEINDSNIVEGLEGSCSERYGMDGESWRYSRVPWGTIVQEDAIEKGKETCGRCAGMW